MKLSTRNQLPGTVVSIKNGIVTAEVIVRLDGGQEVASVITMGSVESLGLQPGSRVAVLIKATEVMVATLD
jgi:molybdate transport system regulatory protein